MRLALILALALLLCACKSTLDRDIGLNPPVSYETLFPYYAELCALSQFKKRPGSVGPVIKGGGPGGHEVLYLNGVCRVGTPGHRTLTLCPPGTPPADSGVGISVNDHYINANWVATPGRDFFFHGILAPGQTLTEDAYRRTIARAQALGLYDGVGFRQKAVEGRPPGESEQDYTYMISLGTDYALSYARDRYCARVPLTREQMIRAVGYLNDVNEPYAAGARQFHWSVFRNNCAHLARNALAQAHIWHGWRVEQSWPVAVFSFPTPKNEFVNLMRRLNDAPIDDIEALYRDRIAHEGLMKDGTLATQPGGLAELERALQRNAVYDPDVSLIFYDDPTLGPYTRRFNRMKNEPRYFDLRANLDYFAQAYQRILARRQPLAFYLKKRSDAGEAERASFAAFYARYYDYMAEQSRAVDAMRRRLGPNQAR
jgi:hypothetical protein